MIDPESVTAMFEVRAMVSDEEPIKFLSNSPSLLVSSIKISFSRRVDGHGHWQVRSPQVTGQWVFDDGRLSMLPSTVSLPRRDQPEWVRQFIQDNMPV
jgi:hypothetical protein